jgi:hypothetical protein
MIRYLAFAAACLLASASSNDEKVAWDFSNAGSKLDAVTQARASSLFNLFNPVQMVTSAKAKQVIIHQGRASSESLCASHAGYPHCWVLAWATT